MKKRYVLCVGLLVLALFGCSHPGSVSSSPSPLSSQAVTGAPASPAQTSSVSDCSSQAQELSLGEKVGELFMIGYWAGSDSQQVLADLAQLNVGSVILMGDWYSSDEVADATAQIAEARPGTLVAVDQEGGKVCRLKPPGFEIIPAAVDQNVSTLHSDWARYATQMSQAGIHLDLAPVADVVPTEKVSINEPVGKLGRGYGNDPQTVAANVTEIVSGLSEGGVGSCVKHFPGLGQVAANTDYDIGYDSVSTLSDEELAPFASAISQGVPSVMVSSAIYTQVDPNNPAVFSSAIVEELLRGRLGFDGVVISDDLGAAKSVAEFPVGQRAIKFFRAGGDLLISVDASVGLQMSQAIIQEAEMDPDFAASIEEKVARVLRLKQQLGVITCHN